MKKILISIICTMTLISSLFIITGCKKEKKEPIVGTWERSGFVYKFNEDKTGIYNASGNKMEFTYEDKGNKVILLYKKTNKKGTYNYKIKKNKLIIKDSFGNDIVYIRK